MLFSCYMGVLAAPLTMGVERCYTFLLLQVLVASSRVQQAELICRCETCYIWQFQVANSVALRNSLGMACESLFRRDWFESESTLDGERSPSVCVVTIREPGDHRTRKNVFTLQNRRGNFFLFLFCCLLLLFFFTSSIDLGQENSGFRLQDLDQYHPQAPQSNYNISSTSLAWAMGLWN